MMLVYFLCWYWWYLPSQLQSPSNLHAELAAPKQSSMKKRVLVKQFICTISCIVLNVWALAYVKSHKTFQNWKTREDWFGIKGKNIMGGNKFLVRMMGGTFKPPVEPLLSTGATCRLASTFIIHICTQSFGKSLSFKVNFSYSLHLDFWHPTYSTTVFTNRRRKNGF